MHHLLNQRVGTQSFSNFSISAKFSQVCSRIYFYTGCLACSQAIKQILESTKNMSSSSADAKNCIFILVTSISSSLARSTPKLPIKCVEIAALCVFERGTSAGDEHCSIFLHFFLGGESMLVGVVELAEKSYDTPRDAADSVVEHSTDSS
jgi:hypothetical protein